MTSKIWPPPNEVEQAQLDDTDDNPLEVCDSCENSPCTCDYCGECDCNPCECENCDMCGCYECECPDVYVVYTTTVVVYVDCDGDLGKVTAMAELDEPVDVRNEEGTSYPHGNPYRERALNAVANNEWPSWDIE